MSEQKTIDLFGRVFIAGKIEAKTGLHIGGGAEAMQIGGLDMPVVREALTQRPYIPGSSLRGKMRSLTEKFTGAVQNWPIGKGVTIHVCQNGFAYKDCSICHIFGTMGQMEFSSPSRLVVRDTPLDDESARKLEQAKTDLPYSEIKWEAAIDRVTSAATPRQIERVPAGAIFAPMEMIYSISEDSDVPRFGDLIQAMQLLEDDYLGGQGSRGSGKVRFLDLEVRCKSRENYDQPLSELEVRKYDHLEALVADREGLLSWIKGQIPTGS